ncbi:pyridoxamine 5'-phosphate oxidase family protein [Nakamurella sp. A5-74]|uniref:Pyridoxamine 5'-phosphate oxidase family protein n=1 Tax=Nakamurella sp. A5-74 TaxID=3158264 RepID=A0AAU8DTC7_9ACTN
MPTMTDDQAQEFLAAPRIGVLSIARVDLEQRTAPLSIPIWYEYAPGGDLSIVTPVDSFKATVLRAAGRATLLVEESVPRIRYVSVECELADELPPDPAHTRAMASRYLPQDQIEQFLANVPIEGRFVLRPVRWRSADLG